MRLTDALTVVFCILLFSLVAEASSLHGRVAKNEIGVRGVTITAEGIGTAVTDSEGYYSFAETAPGTAYRVTAAGDGCTFTPSVIEGTIDGSDEASFAAVGASCGGLYSVAGKVTNSGSPLQGIVVDGGTLGKSVTAADGSFVFTGASFAEFYVIAPESSRFIFAPQYRGVRVHDNYILAHFIVESDLNTPGPTPTPYSGGGCRLNSIRSTKKSISSDLERLRKVGVEACNRLEKLAAGLLKKSPSSKRIRDAKGAAERGEQKLTKYSESGQVFLNMLPQEILSCSAQNTQCRYEDSSVQINGFRNIARTMYGIVRRVATRYYFLNGDLRSRSSRYIGTLRRRARGDYLDILKSADKLPKGRSVCG